MVCLVVGHGADRAQAVPVAMAARRTLAPRRNGSVLLDGMRRVTSVVPIWTSLCVNDTDA